MTVRGSWVLLGQAVLIAAALAGCAPSRVPAPVENRKISKAPAKPAPSAGAMATAKETLPPAPDGFYRVRRGDTLIGISLDHGVAWRDLAAWNQIDNPNLIEVDQLVRVRPPAAPKATVGASTASAESKSAATEIRPLSGGPLASAKGVASSASTPKPAAPPATATASASAPTTPASGAASASASESASASKPLADGPVLSWPSKGQVITSFADPGYKGIAISGSEGDPILAAGDGRVVYSGNGLRGYGNLVIVKHEGDFLTAYAHNKSILVNEGQVVKRGQKIAELGKTDSDVPKLHFEVRRSGKPVDPLKFLAQR